MHFLEPCHLFFTPLRSAQTTAPPPLPALRPLCTPNSDGQPPESAAPGRAPRPPPGLVRCPSKTGRGPPQCGHARRTVGSLEWTPLPPVCPWRDIRAASEGWRAALAPSTGKE